MDDAREIIFITDFEKAIKSYLSKEKNTKIRQRIEPHLNKMKRNVVEKYRGRFTLSPKKKQILSDFIKERIRSENSIHSPQETVDFIYNFRAHKDLKFILHDWDSSRGIYNHSMFIERCLDEFINLLEEKENQEMPFKNLRYDFLTKMFQFLFEENIQNGYGFERIKIGYSSFELEEWCKSNLGKHPRKFPLPENKKYYKSDGREHQYDYFINLIEKFRNEIRIVEENNYFLKFLRKRIRASELNKEFEIHLDKDALSGIDFLIDVDKLAAGLKAIFDPIRKRESSQANKIDFTCIQHSEYIDFSIHHVDSINTRTPLELLHEVKSGDFETAYSNFFSNCDWSIETLDKHKKPFKINILSPKKKYLDLTEDDISYKTLITNGFKHTLRFYKPSK